MSLLIMLSGHNPRVIQKQFKEEEIEPLRVIGAGVAFAALISGALWGHTVWSFWGVAAGLGAGLLAALYVILMDRALIFTSEIRRYSWLATVPAIAARLCPVLAIALLIFLDTVGSIMQPEVAARERTKAQENSRSILEAEDRRLEAMRDAGKAALAALEDERSAIARVEAELRKKRALCWQDYYARKQNAMNTGMSEAEAIQTLAEPLATCNKLRSLHVQREIELAAVTTKLRNARAEIHLQDRSALERQSQSAMQPLEPAPVTATRPSMTALLETLKENPISGLRAAAIMVIYMSVECLGILLRLLLGRSIPGLCMALRHEQRTNELLQQAQAIKRASRLKEAREALKAKIMYQAYQQAYNSPELIEILIHEANKSASALAPMEALIEGISDLEAATTKVAEVSLPGSHELILLMAERTTSAMAANLKQSTGHKDDANNGRDLQ